MNGFLPRAWMVSLFLAVPSAALAQDAPPAETPAEVQPAEGAPAGEVAPAEETKPVEEQKKDEEKSEEAKPAEAAPAAAPVEAAPAAEVAPVEAGAPAAAPAAAPTAQPKTEAAATSEPADEHEEALEAKKKAANQLGAAAPVPPDTGRPWQLFGTAEINMGQGAFLSDGKARQTSIGYALVLQGFYKITKVGEGRLDAVGRVAIDQTITNAYNQIGTLPNEFFFRDIQLGVAGRGLYTEKNTGIVLGAGSSVFLPTSKPSQAMERVLRWTLGVNAAKMISEVGPGNLLITLAEGFRYDFGAASPGLDASESPTGFNSCRSAKDIDECATNIASSHWGLTHTLAVTYLVENFSAAVSLQIANGWNWDLRDHSTISGLEAGDNIEVGRSTNATNEANYLTLTTGSIELGYQVIPEVGVSVGVVTQQFPVVYRDGNPNVVKFPFFNFSGDADNLSQFYLDLNFQY